jgi:putative tryptophan/tyrosine transport system substrate-binding protein
MRPRPNRRRVITLLGGATVAWPVRGRAKQPAIPVIGFVSTRGAADSAALVTAFRQGLSAYIDEANVAIESRWAEGNYERLPALVADLLKRNIDLLVAVGGEPSALAAKAATTTVPIVFIVGGDPVKLGLVQSFNRPGGNATGFTLFTSLAGIEAKRLGLLHELLPNAAIIGVLLNPSSSVPRNLEPEVREAARTIGQGIELVYASTDSELELALAALAAKRVEGLLVGADAFFDTRQDKIIASAARGHIPAIYQSRGYVLNGGLMSYGISFVDTYREAGVYAGKILRGVSPAELPVAQPSKYELVINLKTANALGLVMPQMLLAQANEVIE